ncbi:MAG: DnaD domain protein [Chloroflexi bacterium]|nr:DnaD domain protein [Chloroflexota bacterium]
MAFTEFSTDQLINLPGELFTDVIPQITLLSELKVTLHVFFRIARRRDHTPRRLSRAELIVDPLLLQSLREVSRLRDPVEVFDEGMTAAVRRQTLLRVGLRHAGSIACWYLVHTAANRQWVARHAAGDPPEPATGLRARATIFTLYEQNIGMLTPVMVDELHAAEQRYPIAWIDDAIRVAVRANVRSWRYVERVLERWAHHGRDSESGHGARPIDVERYTSDAADGLFRRGSDVSDL